MQLFPVQETEAFDLFSSGKGAKNKGKRRPKEREDTTKDGKEKHVTADHTDLNEFHVTEDQSGNAGETTTTATTFDALGIEPFLCQTLASLAIHQPTPIQRACIPAILKGGDIIGAAKTGSGKTATFALPMIQTLAKDPYGIFGLVLTPTRELAYQIGEQFKALGSALSLRHTVIVGGMDMVQQALELSARPHIVIATPGRLVDHIISGATDVKLDRIRFLVLDEADRLLEETFADALSLLMDRLPPREHRQTLLFSATMTTNIEQLARVSPKKPLIYRVDEKYDTVSLLSQKYLFIPAMVRDTYLAHLLMTSFQDKTMILFTGKCVTCERLTLFLKELGFKVTALHSHMSQQERLNSLGKFKSGVVSILLATDVASRGLDIPTVKVVLNYDIPADAKDYVHRVGRTARAGRGGIAVSFVTERDVTLFQHIEATLRKKMEAFEGVVEAEALKLLNKVAAARKTATMALTDSGFLERSVERKSRVRQGRLLSDRAAGFPAPRHAPTKQRKKRRTKANATSAKARTSDPPPPNA